MRVLKKTILDLTSVSADTESETIDVQHLERASVQVSWTGSTPSATVAVQVSNDGGTTWTALSGTVTVNSASGNDMIDINDLNYEKLRVAVDYTSGTVSTLKAHLVAKAGH